MSERPLRLLGDPILRTSCEPVTVEGTGELARCLQHETDHLRGILFIDRLSGDQRKYAFRLLRNWQASTLAGP